MLNQVGDRNREFGRLARIAVSIAAVSAALLASAPPALGFPCEIKTVYDYLKPLRGLPPLREVPESEELPFGPAGLHLSQRGFSSVVSWNETFEFRLSSNRSGAPAGRSLDWFVTASLVRVDRHGQVREKLRTVVRHLTKAPGRRGVMFRLPFRFESGLYRYEIVFQNGAGRRLGRFGSYFPALSKSPDHELTLNGTSFQPGETINAKATERGVGWISLEDVYLIESYDGSTWSKAAISPSQISLLIGPLLGPGESTTCWSFQIPTNASPGRYRFAVEGATLMHVKGGLFAQGDPLALTSEFTVNLSPP
jgi:hypothetical protein